MKTKKLLSVLITLAMVLSLLPMTVSVSAEGEQEPVSYWFFDEETLTYDKTRSCTNYEVLNGSTTTLEDGKWYVLDSKRLELGVITVNGNANLILKDGCFLKVNGGIIVEGTNSITIYAQSDGNNMGTLEAYGGDLGTDYSSAAIGGSKDNYAGTITIHGGHIKANREDYFADDFATGIGSGALDTQYNIENPGNITIYGGIIEAYGGRDSAGIGGGFRSSAGTIRIFGGDVTAQGGQFGSGIGSGEFGGTDESESSNITIYGGKVTATGGEGGAGIGGASATKGCDVIVNGGTVTAVGGNGGAGIGGGDSDGNGGSFTIYGGNVTATAGKGAIGIGAGSHTHAIGVAGEGANVTVYGGTVTAQGGAKDTEGEYYPAFGTSNQEGQIVGNGKFIIAENVTLLDRGSDKVLVTGAFELPENADFFHTSYVSFCAVNYTPIQYLSYNATGGQSDELTCANYNIVNSDDIYWSNGWYGVFGDGTINSPITVDGVVNLILTNDSALTLKNGINVQNGAKLNIYEQPGDIKGKLNTNMNGNITIHGGNITSGFIEGNITINGGVVTTTGEYNHAGISGSVTINDGVVNAQGGVNGAGIGGNLECSGGNIVINGGTVNATGGRDAAGIGSGWGGINDAYYCNGGSVTINGGNITAKGDIGGGAGIGGGNAADGGTVTINGGTVTATGQGGGAGIGGGMRIDREFHYGTLSKGGAGGKTVINGGNVTANGATAIGRGSNCEKRLDGTIIVSDEVKLFDNYTGVILAISEGVTWNDIFETGPVSFSALLSNPYIRYNEKTKAFESATADMCLLISENGILSDGKWYIADGELTLDTVSVNGNASLILKDRCKLTVSEGINVPEGSSLTVYAQSEGENMGKLSTTGISGAAGIGGGNITIHGGNIKAVGGSGNGFEGGAGIGSGAYGGGCDVTIYGGNIEAQGADGGAGIGSGYYEIGYDYDIYDYTYDIYENGTAGNIKIYGGNITAKGGYSSAGIGGGYGCDGGTVEIYGGTVNATGGELPYMAGEDCTQGIGCGWFDILDDDDYTPLWSYPVEGGTLKTEGGLIISNGKEMFHKHVYSDAFNDNGDGTHSRKCKYCDVCVDTAPHESASGEYEVNKDGTHSQKCSICDAVINRAEHNFVNGKCSECSYEPEKTLILSDGTVITYDSYLFTIDENGVLIRYNGSEHDVAIPNGVKGIAEDAFGNNSAVREITVPVSVETIRGNAFSGLDLTNIHVGWTDADKIASLEASAFSEYVYANGVLCIPDGAKALYQAHSSWGRFSNIVSYTHSFTSGEYRDNGNGMHSEKCAYCDTYGPSKPHNYTSDVYKDNGDGTHLQKCADCSSYGPAQEHSFTSNVFKRNYDGTHSEKCAYCDAYGDAVAHTLTDGVCACGYNPAERLELSDGTVIIYDNDKFFIDENGVLTKCNSSDSSIVIPDGVKKIGDRAFYGNKTMTEVTIPASVEVIGNHVFAADDFGLPELATVHFGVDSKLKTIGIGAFQNCVKLVNFSFEDLPELETIGGYAFWGTAITSLTIPSSVVSIGEDAFRNAGSLKTLDFEANSSLKSFGSGAFTNTGLTKITLPETFISGGPWLFEMCYDIKSIYVNWEKEDRLLDVQFPSDFNFSQATLSVPKGTTDMYKAHSVWGKFINVIEMEPDHVHDFSGEYTDNAGFTHSRKCVICGVRSPEEEGHTFVNDVCKCGFHKFVIDDNGVLTKYNGSDEDIVIPEGVKQIGESVFWGNNMKSVKLPSSLTTINNSALRECTGLTKVNIPASVEKFGGSVFRRCLNLKAITVNWTEADKIVAPTGASFEGITDCILYVPEGTKELYENHDVWKQFTVVEMTTEPDSLALDITGKTFTVTPSGSDAGTGIVTVALYDSADLNRLLDVKVFELAKTDNLTGEFTQNGYVKAMWWSDLDDIMPLCDAKGENMEVITE